MSAWVFDLGNSRLKFAPLGADGGVGDVQALAHDGAAFEPGWEAHLPARIDDVAWVASVAAPSLRDALLEALGSRATRVRLARTQPAFAGVRIAYAEPSRLGVDRFLALLGAHARGAPASLVVGVGTALTIDLLARGTHLGGRIAPSPSLMRAALHARAPVLPQAGGAYVEFADDTGDALASGCEGAALALVVQSLQAAAARVGQPPALLLHGGGAAALLPRLPEAVHAPALVLEGLAQCARAGA
jgi:type III pantothenate kinase